MKRWTAILLCAAMCVCGLAGGAETTYPTMRKGDNCTAVRTLQEALITVGFTSVKADGVYGAGTVKAVKAFQTAMNLSADGKAGNQTQTMLYALRDAIISGQATPIPQNAVTTAPTAAPSLPAATPAPTANINAASSLSARVNTGSGSLNLRSEPKGGSRVLLRIPGGTVLTVYPQDGAWCVAIYNGQTGYVMTSYLDFNTTAATIAPVVTSAPAASGQPLTASVKTGGGSLNLRDAPKSGSRVLKSIPDGTSLTVYKYNDGWCTTAYNGQSGYIMTSFLSFEIAATPVPVVTATPAPAVTAAPPAGESLGARVSTSGGSLNLRAAPDGNAEVIAEIANGVSLTVIKADSNWYYTVYGVYSGYLMAKYVRLDSEPDQSASSSSVASGKAPDGSSVRLLHWYNEVKPSLSSRCKLLVYDPASGLSWTLRLYSPGHHADSEPLTAEDTQKMSKALGASSWTPRAVYVKLPDGRWTLATMHNVAHLSGSIADNDFNGHLCVHFLRDMDECKRNDPNYGVQHQNAIRRAWKALTGETVE